MGPLALARVCLLSPVRLCSPGASICSPGPLRHTASQDAAFLAAHRGRGGSAMVGGTAAAAKGHGQASDSVGVPGTMAAWELGLHFKTHTHSPDQLNTNRANKSNSGRPIDSSCCDLLVHSYLGGSGCRLCSEIDDYNRNGRYASHCTGPL